MKLELKLKLDETHWVAREVDLLEFITQENGREELREYMASMFESLKEEMRQKAEDPSILNALGDLRKPTSQPKE